MKGRVNNKHYDVKHVDACQGLSAFMITHLHPSFSSDHDSRAPTAIAPDPIEYVSLPELIFFFTVP